MIMGTNIGYVWNLDVGFVMIYRSYVIQCPFY